jgi:hypothetical protein
MLIGGKKLDGPKEEVLVIPRQRDEDIIFKARAVLDYGDFDKLFPRPTPPVVIKPGGLKSLDITDQKYQDQINKWAESRMHWMVLMSLSATFKSSEEELKWETVDLGNPETWGNYQTELKEAGFSDGVIARIVNLVTSVNGLDQDKIDEATERFLAEAREAQENASSQDSVPQNTPSGEPAKDSA